jgi:hypothetical protein
MSALEEIQAECLKAQTAYYAAQDAHNRAAAVTCPLSTELVLSGYVLREAAGRYMAMGEALAIIAKHSKPAKPVKVYCKLETNGLARMWTNEPSSVIMHAQDYRDRCAHGFLIVAPSCTEPTCSNSPKKLGEAISLPIQGDVNG